MQMMNEAVMNNLNTLTTEEEYVQALEEVSFLLNKEELTTNESIVMFELIDMCDVFENVNYLESIQ